jgi:NAD(P)-dependent dehydrogenase (short-subunit alcohol dehydrogenase family)
VDRVPLELPSSIVFPRSLVGCGILPDLQRRRRCHPIEWPDANPACRFDSLPSRARCIPLGDAAIYVHLDVTSEKDWTAAVAAAIARFGKLDILVNNAGLFLGKDIEAASLGEWERLCAVNLTGVFLGTKLCLPALREAAQQSPQWSAIVDLASTAGLVGSTQDPLYSMTKGGVTLFTKSAALEFARKGYRIRVNSMHPGTIDTDMGDQVLGHAGAQSRHQRHRGGASPSHRASADRPQGLTRRYRQGRRVLRL